MKREYHIIKPDSRSDFDIELNTCIQKLKSYSKNRIISLTIFLDAENKKIYEKRIQQIQTKLMEIHISEIPLSIISQAPVENSVLIELLFSPHTINLKRKKWQNINYNLIKHNYGTELVVAGIKGDFNYACIESSAESAFRKIASILKLENFEFDHIVRQWNYIENILDIKHEGEKKTQNYQLFNEARTSFYSGKKLSKGYPAATGIGMKYGGLIMDLIAWKSDAKAQVYSIDNPKQIASYKYGQNILIGYKREQKHKSPPKFERGKLICANGQTTLFVSGTASILGEDTIGYNDIEKQTITTINNIHLIQKESCKKENHDFNKYGQLKNLRVYMKDKKYYNFIKEICNKTIGEIPAVYVEADICRKELLVEIEAEYGN